MSEQHLYTAAEARQLWPTIEKAIYEAAVNRHEYMLTQGDCHRKNCGLGHGHGDPEGALLLVQKSIAEHVYNELFFPLTEGDMDE